MFALQAHMVVCGLDQLAMCYTGPMSQLMNEDCDHGYTTKPKPTASRNRCPSHSLVPVWDMHHQRLRAIGILTPTAKWMECQCAAAAAAWGFDQSMSISRWTLNEGCWLNPNMIIFVGGLSACSLCNFPWLTSIPRFVGQALKISSIPLFFWVEITWPPELLLGQHVFLGGPGGSNGSQRVRGGPWGVQRVPTGPSPTPVRPHRERTAGVLRRRWQRRPECGRAGHGCDLGKSWGFFWWRLMGLEWD